MAKRVKKRYFLRIILVVVAVFLAALIYYPVTDDFRMGNLVHDMPAHPEWESPPLSPADKQELTRILDQEFSYMGKGAQSYVFGSADGKYVLKFFKFKHLKPSLIVEWLPTIPPLKKYKETQRKRKQRKLQRYYL